MIPTSFLCEQKHNWFPIAGTPSSSSSNTNLWNTPSVESSCDSEVEVEASCDSEVKVESFWWSHFVLQHWWEPENGEFQGMWKQGWQSEQEGK